MKESWKFENGFYIADEKSHDLAKLIGPKLERHRVGPIMSAAPDLLSACKELRERLMAFCGATYDITDVGQDVEAIKRADAAIAKAGGES